MSEASGQTLADATTVPDAHARPVPDPSRGRVVRVDHDERLRLRAVLATLVRERGIEEEVRLGSDQDERIAARQPGVRRVSNPESTLIVTNVAIGSGAVTGSPPEGVVTASQPRPGVPGPTAPVGVDRRT